MRKAVVERKTRETEVKVLFDIDGSGKYEVNTGIGFFGHMLELFAAHGLFDLNVYCKGDTNVDAHHSVEDTGLALGRAIFEAAGDKKGITRYGTFFAPMDEALVMVSLDMSGRPYLAYDMALPSGAVGGFDTETAEDFFRALSNSSGMTLHIKMLSGRNTHHIIEAAFKAFARALRTALTIDDRVKGVPSTKGTL